MRWPKNVAKSPPGQYAEILEGRNGRLQEVEQTGVLIMMMLAETRDGRKKGSSHERNQSARGP